MPNPCTHFFSRHYLKEATYKVMRKSGRLLKSGVAVLIKLLLFVAYIVAAFWVGLILWVHVHEYAVLRWTAVIGAALLSCAAMVVFWRRPVYWQRWLSGYTLLWSGVALWFFALEPQQDRHWKAEVAHSVSFTQDKAQPNLVTANYVRDFEWVRPATAQPLEQPDAPYFYKVASEDNKELVAGERWTERSVDLSQITGVDIINSYWMGEAIGHTLLSFRFENERPLSFSFEIRKEHDEDFSVFGGFVRQFEIALIAAEERDIVYTRSNVRGEQVYLFPIEGMTQPQMQDLFRQYMQASKALHQSPKWYNTLIKNCTTIIFDFADEVSGGRLPWDYRIIASGYVPDYLFDKGLLPNNKVQGVRHNPDYIDNTHMDNKINSNQQQQSSWSIKQWYKQAHINPKVASFSPTDNQSGHRYSQLIRQGLPVTSENK